jgi:adenosylmethionine-8-amino-7-oxononanoate aminotransferase
MSALIRNDLAATPTPIAYAEGVWLVGEDDRRYIDGSSGAVVVSIGHGHPKVAEAADRQARKVSFLNRGSFAGRPSEELAERLCAWTGFDAVWLVNSGSESVEAAIQFALQYHRERGDLGRQSFLSFDYGYHGATLGGLSLSHHVRRTAAAGLALNFPTLPTPYRLVAADDVDESAYAEQLLTQARRVFADHGPSLAGVIVEPVGGATLGATVPPDGYLQGLRELCDEFGALLILDEVMSGCGRTGRVLAAEHWGVRADITTIGKGLSSGYAPIAATLLRAHVLEPIAQGSGRVLGGHTFGGNPLSAATTLAVLDVFETDDLVRRGARASASLAEGLDRLADHHAIVREARGLGMLRAIELNAPADTAPGKLSAQLLEAALAEGLALYPCTGGFNDAVLVAPPLIISDDEIQQLLTRLDRALATVGKQPALVGSGR